MRAGLCLLLLLPGACAANPDAALLRARPFRLELPPALRPNPPPGTPRRDATHPAPLLIALHGFGSEGAAIDPYFGLGPLAAARGIIYVVPDGLPDGRRLRFWNATDACCDLEGRRVDDVRYLSAIIRDVSARYPVDRARVFVVGHSNGGFMAHRMACDASELIAGIVSLAGVTWQDEARCRPRTKVAVLQVHGTGDDVIRYGGGRYEPQLPAYPSARESVARWARVNGCSATLSESGPPLDLDSALPGPETRVARHRGCRFGAAELWSIEGAGHIPRLAPPVFGAAILDFLLAHPKTR